MQYLSNTMRGDSMKPSAISLVPLSPLTITLYVIYVCVFVYHSIYYELTTAGVLNIWNKTNTA